PCPQVHRQARDFRRVHQHPAGLRRHQAHNHVKARGFAGAVWPQQSNHFAAGDRQVHAPDNLPSLVALADSLGNQCFHSVFWLASRYLLRASGAVVSVIVSRPPPSILTLSSRLWKIKAAPVTFPCVASLMRGGAPAVPVST